jgi:hypothetical protein
MRVDASHVDASICGANVLVTCDVAITCSAAVSHLTETACASATAPSVDDVSNKVIAKAMMGVSCTTGATYAVTCTAPPTAWDCPLGIEMESDVTACVSMQPYDSPIIADVCAHLPSGMGAWLHAFAMPGKVVTTYTCQSTDAIVFIAAAR